MVRVLAGGLFGVVALLAWARPAGAGVVYFQVAERPGQVFHGDSFVLPLIEADDIAHARDLIARGPEVAERPIVFAHIAAGSDGINRDLNQPGQPEWSWHVSQFDDFNDFGIELVDGNPTLVEEDVQGWLKNTNSQIGFWNYTVVRELPGYPDVRPGQAVPLPAALPAAAVTLGGLGFAGWRIRRR
jgi:hypothetical protein